MMWHHKMWSYSSIVNKGVVHRSCVVFQESNQLHACCLDTFPPIFYMTDTSRDIVRLVHAVNSHFGENKVCYFMSSVHCCYICYRISFSIQAMTSCSFYAMPHTYILVTNSLKDFQLQPDIRGITFLVSLRSIFL